MLFGRSGEVVRALHERHSRLLLAVRAPSTAAGPIAETIAGVLGPLPPVFRQTMRGRTTRRVLLDRGYDHAPSASAITAILAGTTGLPTATGPSAPGGGSSIPSPMTSGRWTSRATSPPEQAAATP